MCLNSMLVYVFILKMLFQATFQSKSKSIHLFVVVFLCSSGQLGIIYDSQTTNRSALGEMGVLAGSPPCFLLITWESYMTPSRAAMHYFIAIWTGVKETVRRDLRGGVGLKKCQSIGFLLRNQRFAFYLNCLQPPSWN
jgi:hypothetical protein